jgi:CheY-like chemotaxis protein
MSGATFGYLKALVVEDNVHMRALLRSLLTALGMKHVYEAANGTDAFELLREKRPDLVLSDLTMKPMDGIAFTRKVRLSEDSPNPYVPIIMITGHTERHKVEEARDAGVTEFLAKPITPKSWSGRAPMCVARNISALTGGGAPKKITAARGGGMTISVTIWRRNDEPQRRQADATPARKRRRNSAGGLSRVRRRRRGAVDVGLTQSGYCRQCGPRHRKQSRRHARRCACAYRPLGGGGGASRHRCHLRAGP